MSERKTSKVKLRVWVKVRLRVNSRVLRIWVGFVLQFNKKLNLIKQSLPIAETSSLFLMPTFRFYFSFSKNKSFKNEDKKEERKTAKKVKVQQRVYAITTTENDSTLLTFLGSAAKSP